MSLSVRADISAFFVKYDVFSVLADYLRYVIYPAGIRLPEPQKIEDTYVALFLLAGRRLDGASVIVKANDHIVVISVSVQIHRLKLLFHVNICFLHSF